MDEEEMATIQAADRRLQLQLLLQNGSQFADGQVDNYIRILTGRYEQRDADMVLGRLGREQRAQVERVLQAREEATFLQRRSSQCVGTPTDGLVGQPGLHLKFSLLRKARPQSGPKWEGAAQFSINGHSAQIQAEVHDHDVTILEAETGAGKSSQIGLILTEGGEERPEAAGRVLLTQPRRLCCVQLSRYVAALAGGRLRTGYRVRFEDTTNSRTMLHMYTDGMLLSVLLGQQDCGAFLGRFGYVVVDEAHECTLPTVLLCFILKRLLLRRQLRCKLLIMSASLAHARTAYARYFAPATVSSIRVPGRTYNVALNFAEDDVRPDRRLDHGLAVLRRILGGTGIGRATVLFFLPGEREIRQAITAAQNLLAAVCPQDPVEMLPLYAGLPLADQQRALKPATTARVVFSTNVAETSLTIPDCRVVVDTGLVKQMSYNERKRCNVLSTVNICYDNFLQRKGRAGRVADGSFYACYSERQLKEEFASQSTPDLLRMQQENVVLQIIQVHNLLGMAFDPHNIDLLIQMPSVVRPIANLRTLGLINQQFVLSDLAHKIIQDGMDINMAFLLHGCQDDSVLAELCKIVAVVNSDSGQLRATLRDDDRCLCYNDYQLMIQHFNDVTTAQQSYYGHYIQELQKQLFRRFQKGRAGAHDRDNMLQLVTDGILGSFKQNIAYYDPQARAYCRFKQQQWPARGSPTCRQQSPENTDEDLLYIHPSSVTFVQRPQTIVFLSVLETDKTYMIHCSQVTQMQLDGLVGK